MEPANPFQAFLIKLDSLSPPRRLQLIGSVLQALVHSFWKSVEKWHVGGWPWPPPPRAPTLGAEQAGRGGGALQTSANLHPLGFPLEP